MVKVIEYDEKESMRLPEKKFMMRNSLLTDLPPKIPNTKTFFNFFIWTSISLFFGTVTYDHLITKKIQFGFNLIYLGFGKLYIVLFSWILFMTLTCMCYVFFNIWAEVRRTLQQKKKSRMWDAAWTLALAAYYIFCFKLASHIVETYRLPPASAIIVLVEKVRLLMKVHAFVRTSAENILKYKPHSDQDLAIPTFAQYLYFLFAPTLVFRNEYPRSQGIRWRFIAGRVLEIAGIIFFQNFLFDRFLIPPLTHFGVRKFTLIEISVLVIRHSFLVLLFYLSGFYLILHAVQNLFAELLRFGDRLFYRDWWNSTSFSMFFGHWNVVVRDWLYTYIYKDSYEHAFKRKGLAKLSTFLVSALVHEWVLAHTLGFFFPALFMFYLAFMIMITIERKGENIDVFNKMLWIGSTLGNSILVSSYTMEYFASVNSSGNDHSSPDNFSPKFLLFESIVLKL